MSVAASMRDVCSPSNAMDERVRHCDGSLRAASQNLHVQYQAGNPLDTPVPKKTISRRLVSDNGLQNDMTELKEVYA